MSDSPTPSEPSSPPESPANSQGPEPGKPPASAPLPVRLDERNFTQLVPQFFIFPLVLVTIIVMIYVLFGASAENNRTVEEVLHDLHSGWLQTKNRAAYELAMRTKDMEEKSEKFTPEVTEEILRILSSNEDSKIRSYLFRALGSAGDPELSLPALLKFLTEGKSDNLEEKVEAIRGLGLSRSPEALPPLYQQLQLFQGEENWEPRLITLSAIAHITSSAGASEEIRRPAIEELKKGLSDPKWMVSWNCAAVLADRYKDPSGVHILRNLLDREYIKKVDKNLEQEKFQEDWVITAVRSLIALEDEVSYKKIEEMRQDPSARVRNIIYLWEDAKKKAEASKTK